MPRVKKEPVIQTGIRCLNCNGSGVIPQGYKFWKTCPECHGDKYVGGVPKV